MMKSKRNDQGYDQGNDQRNDQIVICGSIHDLIDKISNMINLMIYQGAFLKKKSWNFPLPLATQKIKSEIRGVRS